MHASRRGSTSRGMAWPLSTPDLRRILGDRLGTTAISWYERPDSARDDGLLAMGRWSPVTEPVWLGGETATALTLVAVDEAEVEVVRAVLLEAVLPEFVAWQDEAMAAGHAWQALRHAVRWSLVDGKVRRLDHHQSRRREGRWR